MVRTNDITYLESENSLSHKQLIYQASYTLAVQ
jgi:hypothetical protein